MRQQQIYEQTPLQNDFRVNSSSLFDLCVHLLQNQGPSCEATVLHCDIFHCIWAVLWLRQLHAGHPPWRQRFDHGTVHVRFVMYHTVLGQVFLTVQLFLPCKYNCSSTPHSFNHPPLMLHDLCNCKSLTHSKKKIFQYFIKNLQN